MVSASYCHERLISLYATFSEGCSGEMRSERRVCLLSNRQSPVRAIRFRSDARSSALTRPPKREYVFDPRLRSSS